MTKRKIENPGSFDEAGRDLTAAVTKLVAAAKAIDAADWPRDMILSYTTLRNAANAALGAFDAVARKQRDKVLRELSAKNLERRSF